MIYLNTSQVAERIGFSIQTVRRMCEQGTFPNAVRSGTTGTHWRIPKADVDAHLAPTRPFKRNKDAK